MESALQKLQFCLLRAILLTLKNLSGQILRGKQSYSGINVINRYLFAMKYNLTTYLHNRIVMLDLNLVCKRLEESMTKVIRPLGGHPEEDNRVIWALPTWARLSFFSRTAKKLGKPH